MVDTEPLDLRAPATADNVARLRRALRRWLHEVLDEDPDAADDLTLAASEALENTADHAFADRAAPGTVTLTARTEHTGTGRCVLVVVSDDGRWQPPGPHAGYRRRGLALIGQLAATHTVRTADAGTTVTLHHTW